MLMLWMFDPCGSEFLFTRVEELFGVVPLDEEIEIVTVKWKWSYLHAASNFECHKFIVVFWRSISKANQTNDTSDDPFSNQTKPTNPQNTTTTTLQKQQPSKKKEKEKFIYMSAKIGLQKIYLHECKNRPSLCWGVFCGAKLVTWLVLA